MAIAQFRDVASSAHVRTKQMKRKKYQRRGKAVAEKPLQLLQVMLLEKSYLTGTKPFAAQLRLNSAFDFLANHGRQQCETKATAE